MAWGSFTDITDLVVAALAGYADLKTFCISNWKKPPAVRKFYKKREEVSLTELPLVMVTVPSQRSTPAAARLLYREYTLRLYCGFQEDDRGKAQDLIIKFEEFIEQALLIDAVLNAQNIEIEVGDSANDEGQLHPVYFIVKEFTILIERDA